LLPITPQWWKPVWQSELGEGQEPLIPSTSGATNPHHPPIIRYYAGQPLNGATLRRCEDSCTGAFKLAGGPHTLFTTFERHPAPVTSNAWVPVRYTAQNILGIVEPVIGLVNLKRCAINQLLSHIRAIEHDNDVSRHNHTSQVRGQRSRKISDHRLGALNVALKWEGEEPSSFTKILVDQIP
jgi:hypothetical protein